MNIPTHNTPESLFRWIIDHVDFGIIITDCDLNITHVNHWIEKTSGKTRSELIGHPILDTFPEIRERKLDHYLSQALNGASSILSARFHKYFLRLKSLIYTSDVYMKQTVKISSAYAHTSVNGVVIQIDDVTERMNHEELLQKKNENLTKLNSTKDKFFNIIAHDLRSPFTALIGFTEILKEDNTLSPQQTKNIINMLHSSVKSQYYFLENLLKWAQMQTGKYRLMFSHFALNDVVNHIIEVVLPIREAKNIDIEVHIPDEISMFSDSNALTTILYNLINNALKFTKSGGTVKITATKDSGITTITVNDNGVGIAEDRIGKLFRIDESTSTLGTSHEKGSGLGLILIKDLVEYMKGKIWLESTLGKGSSFYLLIPDTEDN